MILGDLTIGHTLKMLNCTEAASHMTNTEMLFPLKLHSFCPIKKETFPALRFQYTESNLAEIMEDFDIAFSSNTFSAGLDVLPAEIDVVVYLDEGELNLSPLRGLPNMRFATTPSELPAALQAEGHDQAAPAPIDFFWLDAALPRWARLLFLPARA